MSHRTLTD